MKIYYLALFSTIILAGCAGHQHPSKTNDSSSIKKLVVVKDSQIVKKGIEKNIDTATVRELDFGFKVRVSGEGVGEILHNNIRLFIDTAHAYTLYNKVYPIIKKIDTNTFELLVETDERPSKNLAQLFKVKNNKVSKQGQIPTFDGKPEMIDSVLTYHGFWDYGEVWGTQGKMRTVYNPVLYYKFSVAGWRLDTAITIKKIKQEYGRFRGFSYSSKFGYPSDDRGNITDTADQHVLKEVD